MKKRNLIYVTCMLIAMGACSATSKNQAEVVTDTWGKYNVGTILFEDKAPETKGSDVYHRIIPDAESYIKAQAREVLATLYNSPDDSIPTVNKIHYTLEDIEGVSAKGGGNGDVTIFETRGVLLHELTHAYQLEPQGIGSYGTNRVFWAFIEGMADAVRVANGGFDGPNARPKGGNYMDGYRTAGYFFVWLRDNKDPEFLRKFNRSTLEVVPWSFDGAIKHILGNEYNIDELWHEYQVAVGDIQA